MGGIINFFSSIKYNLDSMGEQMKEEKEKNLNILRELRNKPKQIKIKEK